MKIKLCITSQRYHLPTDCDEIEVADGLTDDQIEETVREDLQEMAFEYVDVWWERVTE